MYGKWKSRIFNKNDKRYGYKDKLRLAICMSQSKL